ncbi:MAG: hypothetical protein ACT4OX_10095, partial [Actinomycetota bacterium]
LEGEQSYLVDDEHTARMLVARLTLRAAGLEPTLLDANGIDELLDTITPSFLDDIGGWLSDTLDSIPGVPNLAALRRMIEDIAEFDIPAPVMTFTAAAASIKGQANLHIGAMGSGGITAELSAATGGATGPVNGPDGQLGFRTVVRGSAVAEAGISTGAQSTGIRGLNEQGAIDVTALYDSAGDLSSVTAVVTTESRDEATMRVTTFDLDNPNGVRAAELVRDFAFAPGGILLTPQALDLIAADTTEAGVNQTSQTFALDSEQYGFGLSFPNPAVELGVTAEIEIARLEPQ